MKHLKLFENYTRHLLDGNFLYHYTLVDNLDSIMSEGLKPNKNPNYSNGSEAVFLTNKSSLSKANLPQHLMDELEWFYEEIGEKDYENDDRPIVRLKIDISQLDEDLFAPDDDYLENRYGWNKAKTYKEQLEESLEIWGSIAYKGFIDSKFIIDKDFDYYS
jgi:hypothetical protein